MSRSTLESMAQTGPKFNFKRPMTVDMMPAFLSSSLSELISRMKSTPFDHDNVSQSYTYNSSSSFVTLGKCDGCGCCQIVTRLQFDPEVEGLKISFQMVGRLRYIECGCR
ncbi:unnamed protein product [Prorocentrum cordatum]|uniref:Phospholipid scramblase n=1 Tax=Prorocentrum cordatum TaxID=2364126 RepID=A0ABN9VMZ9_9DINO|nr:unnamed protein product [Polarella glacialis]